MSATSYPRQVRQVIKVVIPCAQHQVVPADQGCNPQCRAWESASARRTNPSSSGSFLARAVYVAHLPQGTQAERPADTRSFTRAASSAPW